MKSISSIVFAVLLAGCIVERCMAEPVPPPLYTRVNPTNDNPQHFVARTKDLLKLVRKHPAPAGDPWFQINGLQFWPATPISVDALRVMDWEGGKFDRAQRDQALRCGLPGTLPPDTEVVLLDAQENRLVVPVFLKPDDQGLGYLDLSIDRPGAPVLLVITGNEGGLAVRISVSPATHLAAVHLNTYYPSVVLGVEPDKVTREYYEGGPNNNCRGGGTGLFKHLGYGPEKAVHYKTEGETHFSIGTVQPANRNPPMLGTFLDPEMPAPSRYGILALANLGYLRPSRTLTLAEMGRPVLDVLKPFRVPAGLAGAHSVTLVLRPRSPSPSGDLGHSSIIRQTK
jgi:hypothetical protein